MYAYVCTGNYNPVSWPNYLWPGATVGDISYWLKAQQGTVYKHSSYIYNTIHVLDYSATKSSNDHIYLPQMRSTVTAAGFYPGNF